MNEKNDDWFVDLDQIYGGTMGIARELGIRETAVSNWREQGFVPPLRQLQFHLLHPKKFPRERLSANALPPRLRRRDVPAAAA